MATYQIYNFSQFFLSFGEIKVIFTPNILITSMFKKEKYNIYYFKTSLCILNAFVANFERRMLYRNRTYFLYKGE